VLAGIQSITVDKSGNYYIFDYKHGTIIKLDRELVFVKAIGRKGEGPGEFRIMGRTPNHISIGLDGNLYLFNWASRRIKKYSPEGKHIRDFSYEQFNDFRVLVDEKGTFYLPSVKGHIFDVHDSKMNYQKSLLPGSDLKTFLFFDHPACITIRRTNPGYSNMRHDWLSTKEIVLINQFDLSVSIINPENGKVVKKFYAWDDFILSEFKKKIKRSLDRTKNSGNCSYCWAFITFFVDNKDNIFLEFLSTDSSQYLYKFSREGDMIQLYQIERAEIDGIPYFFQYKNNKFYSETSSGIHIFREKIEKK
jgi:hypothetical protein